MLFILGSLYFLFGLLCFKKLKNRHLFQIRKRNIMKQEMIDLNIRKDEIERLMAETETKLEKI